jgi:hypothetical protein
MFMGAFIVCALPLVKSFLNLFLPHRSGRIQGRKGVGAGHTSGRALASAVGLMSKYADVPMDFPDATLVWIAESPGTDRILTLDRRGVSSFRFGKNRRFKLLLDL